MCCVIKLTNEDLEHIFSVIVDGALLARKRRPHPLCPLRNFILAARLRAAPNMSQLRQYRPSRRAQQLAAYTSLQQSGRQTTPARSRRRKYTLATRVLRRPNFNPAGRSFDSRQHISLKSFRPRPPIYCSGKNFCTLFVLNSLNVASDKFHICGNTSSPSLYAPFNDSLML